MTFPGILFGFAVSTLFGGLFHLWRGGGLIKLIWFILCSWAGFWLGQYFAASFASFQFLTVGPLHLGPASFGCFIFLAAGYWLSLVQYTPGEG